MNAATITAISAGIVAIIGAVTALIQATRAKAKISAHIETHDSPHT